MYVRIPYTRPYVNICIHTYLICFIYASTLVTWTLTQELYIYIYEYRMDGYVIYHIYTYMYIHKSISSHRTQLPWDADVQETLH